MADLGVFITSEDFRKTRSRVVLDYTNRDFAAIRGQLVGLAKGFMPEWETVGEAGDFGTLLLELFAYMGDVMHFYIDRTASEAFLGTALRRQSVLYIADMLGYVPIGQQAAVVILNFGLDERAAEVANPNAPDENYTVTLPAGTRVTTGQNTVQGYPTVFELLTSVSLQPGDSGIEAAATEGVTVSNYSLGTSRGVPHQAIALPQAGVVSGSVEVLTREGGNIVNWAYVSDISLSRPTQSAFTTYLDDQNMTFVVFGDNSSGRIPPIGAEVFCSYRYGVGASANDLEPDTINTLIPPTGVETWGVTVTNPSSPIGGADPETVETMRFSIPRAMGRLKSRAVTINDYADLALQVPGVAKAVAYGTIYTAVFVRVAPVGGQADDAYMSRLCLAVEHHLDDKVLVGSKVYAEPQTLDDLWVNAQLRMTVHVQSVYNRTNIRKAVEASLRSLFSFDTLDFGSQVTIGQVYRSALAVEGVEWAELTWMDTSSPGSGWEEAAVFENDDTRVLTNIVTDDLHIPRIDTTSVVEDVSIFPDLTLEERTHDGLWLRALGGLVGT